MQVRIPKILCDNMTHELRDFVSEERMSEHQVTANFQGNIEIANTDLKVVVKKNGRVFGTLTLSKGSIDWRPKKKWVGGKNEVSLSWTKFDEKMRE